MTFTLPSNLPTNWVDNIGMIEDAAFLNNVGTMANDLRAAVLALVTGPAAATVATSESTTSTSYTDLTTTTDTVTVTIGASGIALVVINSINANSNSSSASYASFAASGANTITAIDGNSAESVYPASFTNFSATKTIFLTGLTAGSTTFKMKYKIAAGGGTATFSNRTIGVIPFP